MRYKQKFTVRVPCPIGTTVYQVHVREKGQNPCASLLKRYVSAYYVGDGFGARNLKYKSYAVLRPEKGDLATAHVALDKFGQTVFLSVADAKAAWPRLEYPKWYEEEEVRLCRTETRSRNFRKRKPSC